MANGFDSDPNILLTSSTYGYKLVDKLNNRPTVGKMKPLQEYFQTYQKRLILLIIAYTFIETRALWIPWYFTNGSQTTSVGPTNSHETRFEDIACGVPQGSILIPLLLL